MKITYGNKSYLNQNVDIPVANKVCDTDMNEIKSVVNNNDDETQSVIQNFAYSTTEQETLDRWTNGEVIYRKVYTPQLASGNNDITLENNLDTIINVYGTVIQPSNNISPLTYYQSSTDWCNWFYRKSNNALVVRCGSTAGYGAGRIVVEYTKSS